MIDFTNGALYKLQSKKIDTDLIEKLLISDEKIVATYQALRDHVVFTTKRLICVNVKGITGKKKDFTSLPYSKIQVFSVETAGSVDLDSELELYFAGLGKVHLDFERAEDVLSIGKMIGSYVL